MNITQEEFLRLLDTYTNAYTLTVFASRKTKAEYDEAAAKAVEAKQALIKAVFEGRSE